MTLRSCTRSCVWVASEARLDTSGARLASVLPPPAPSLARELRAEPAPAPAPAPAPTPMSARVGALPVTCSVVAWMTCGIFARISACNTRVRSSSARIVAGSVSDCPGNTNVQNSGCTCTRDEAMPKARTATNDTADVDMVYGCTQDRTNELYYACINLHPQAYKSSQPDSRRQRLRMRGGAHRAWRAAHCSNCAKLT